MPGDPQDSWQRRVDAYQLSDKWLRDTNAPTAPDQATYERMSKPGPRIGDQLRHQPVSTEEQIRRWTRQAQAIDDAVQERRSQVQRSLRSPARPYTGADAWLA